MRKSIAVILAATVAMICLSITAFAVQPRYAYFSSNISTLDISSSGTASCKSKATANSLVRSIEGTQYLERKSGNDWVTVSNCEWSDSSSYNYLSMTNSKSGLSSGTYRVRCVFTAYSTYGSEESESISFEVTI